METDDKGRIAPSEERPGSSPEGRGGRKPGPRARTLLIFLALFIAGVLGGYLVLSKGVIRRMERPPVQAQKAEPAKAEEMTLRVYYPYNGRLNMEERKASTLASKAALAGAAVAEFLKGPAKSLESLVPTGARLLGVYPGNDGILYVDLSDEFRRNFQGDALSEHLLLRGLYESVASNAYGVEGVKVLVEGQEVETVGGHVSAARPLTAGSFQMEKEDAGAE